MQNIPRDEEIRQAILIAQEIETAIIAQRQEMEREKERVSYAEGEALAWGRALLSDAIAASGLSVRGFARAELTGAPGIQSPNIRTVWRWLKGDSAMPAAVRERCEAIVAARVGVSP